MRRGTWWPWLCLPALAQAHLMPAGQGSVRLTADSAWLAVAVPVATLHGWEGDASGRITLAQLMAQRESLLAQLRGRVRVDAGGDPGRTLYEDLLFEAADDGAASTDQLVLLRRDSWPRAPRSLRLHVDLAAGGSDGALTLRALRGTEAEVVKFGPGRNDAAVFVPPSRALPWLLLAALSALTLALRRRLSRA